MTGLLLFIYTVAYLLVLYLMMRHQWQLRTFVWGSFGMTFLLLQLALLIDLPEAIAALEVQHIQALMGLFGVEIQTFEATTMLVPDDIGWVAMTIGIESSTLIEMAVFSSIILFYQGLTVPRRFGSMIVGIVLTYLLNLVRLLLIVFAILIWGRDAFVIAHTFVGRIIYFAGVLLIYWYLLTQPTITQVGRTILRREA